MSLRKRCQSERSYEFAIPEAALMLVACAMALGTVTGVWPSVQVQRRRVRVRLAVSEGAAGALEQRVWRELDTWARQLGGEPVAAGPVT